MESAKSDIWLVKLDSDGGIEWDRSVGTTNIDFAQSLQVTPDGGVLICGYSFPSFITASALSTLFLTKVGPDGTQLWQLEFTEPINVKASSGAAVPMPDGGAVIGLSSSWIPADGSSRSTNYFCAEDIWLIRFDANGRRLWDVTLGGNGVEYLSSLSRTRDGGFIVAMSSDTATAGANGNKTYPGYGGLDMWIAKLSPELPPDSDGDGVPDANDKCPNTPCGAIVNSNGCSIAQIAPCDGPWRNHGQYVNAVARTSTQFRKAGVISHQQRLSIFLQAVKSHCGKKSNRKQTRFESPRDVKSDGKLTGVR